MANLKQGSSGSDVQKMQQALIDAGYNVGNTGADGVFGSNTLAAVKQYQKDNGLAVDGIAGQNTLGSLYGSGSNTNNAPTTSTGGGTNNNAAGSTGAGTGSSKDTFTTPAGNTYDSFTYDDFTYDPFQGSDTLNQAWNTLGQLQGNAPSSWTDPYRDQYMGYLNQYENRDPFSYDFNSDMLYQQYKDQYIQQGQMAMQDTMGQAAAMTGGYGNSYAQTVGQQTYNQYLSQLNDIIPELYGMAYDRYQQEGQDLLAKYDLYRGLSDQSYNQYLGEVDNYYKQLGAASDYANTLYGKEYGEWSDKTKMDFDTWSANTGLSYDEWAAKTGIISDENNTLMNQKFTSEENQKDRDFQANENAKSRAASASKSSTGSSTSTGKNTMSNSDQQMYMKSADKAVATQGVNGLYAIGEQMEFEGYSDAFISAWIEKEMNRLFPESKQAIVKPGSGVSGGGGGGTMYNAVK